MKSYKKSQIDFLKALVLKVGAGFGDLRPGQPGDIRKENYSTKQKPHGD